jgi:hypothetical protein
MIFEDVICKIIATECEKKYYMVELLELQHQYSKNRMGSGKALSFHIVHLYWFRCLEKGKIQLHHLRR